MPNALAMPPLGIPHRGLGVPSTAGRIRKALSTGVGPIRSPLADFRQEIGTAVRAGLARPHVCPLRPFSRVGASQVVR